MSESSYPHASNSSSVSAGPLSSTEWRPVPGHPEYEISNAGRLRSLDRIDRNGRFRAGRLVRLRRRPTRIEVVLSRDGMRRYTALSHLVLLAFVGPRPDGSECCHRDGDFTNNSAENLYWGTHSENLYDQVRHGTHPHASKTECIRGHQLSDPRNVETRRGKRECLLCERIRRKNRYQQDLARRNGAKR